MNVTQGYERIELRAGPEDEPMGAWIAEHTLSTKWFSADTYSLLEDPSDLPRLKALAAQALGRSTEIIPTDA